MWFHQGVATPNTAKEAMLKLRAAFPNRLISILWGDWMAAFFSRFVPIRLFPFRGIWKKYFIPQIQPLCKTSKSQYEQRNTAADSQRTESWSASSFAKMTLLFRKWWNSFDGYNIKNLATKQLSKDFVFK